MDDIMTNKKTSERIREWVELVYDEGPYRGQELVMSRGVSLSQAEQGLREHILWGLLEFIPRIRRIKAEAVAKKICDDLLIDGWMFHALDEQFTRKALAMEKYLSAFCGKTYSDDEYCDYSNCPLVTDDHILDSLYGGGCLEWGDDLMMQSEDALRAGLELALCYEEAGD